LRYTGKRIIQGDFSGAEIKYSRFCFRIAAFHNPDSVPKSSDERKIKITRFLKLVTIL